VHALSALDDGLKLCADHPALRELRQEMNTQFEERASPPVTPAFLAAAKVATSRDALEQGRQLYTSRCAECHELEMIDSRGRSGWEKAVGGMSRRAGFTSAEQSKVLDYLAAAVAVVAATGEK
jgi:cytochrome c2